MSNYSILMQNTLDGLSETAGALYCKLLDAFEAHKSPNNERRAFLAADRYDRQCGEVLDYIIRNNPANHVGDETLTALAHFFAERWRHNFMGEQHA